MQQLDKGLMSKGVITQLQQLKASLFSGSVLLKASEEFYWQFYFRLGRLSWQTGGMSEERWKRHLASFCPKVNVLEIDKQISVSSEVDREYQILAKLQEKELIQRQQLIDWVTTAASEVLFDVIQYCEFSREVLACEVIPNDTLGIILTLVELEQVLHKTMQSWQEWQNAGLAAYSPNLFPIVQQPDSLKQKAPANLYKLISTLVDGTKSLRNLAFKSNVNLVTLTRAFIPLVDAEVISFSKIPCLKKFDFPAIDRQAAKSGASITRDTGSNNYGDSGESNCKPLIACVDDSPLVAQALQELLNKKGFRFLSIQDSVKALPILLKNKPDFIFLDLLMPVTNGYEVCSQLRKTSSLQQVPIVILTGRDGLVDRMRARVVGATDFMTKPIEAEQVLTVINKYSTWKK